MSDDEYEYEYDDDDMEEENFEYTDEEEEADDGEVALENAYYNAKGLREQDLQEAAKAFEQVIIQEKDALADDDSKYGPWSYKAMKQLVKLHLRNFNQADMDAVLKNYNRLLDCIAHGNVSPNAVEKGIHGMLERVSSLYQGNNSNNAADATADGGETAATSNPQQRLALEVYDATLKVFHPSNGSCPNERLWFKTNLKYGQLLYEMHETAKLQQVLRDLKSNENKTSSNESSSTQSMEIYALQIQLYSRQKDHKKLRQVFHKAMAVRGGIPHPRTLALIQELGGKMHMAAKEYEAAGKTFFQAFKSYDEAGDPNRLKCLKYLVLASMLHASSINPFDSQEARPYRDDPEITAMTNLVQAFHNNEISKFERILRQERSGRQLMQDEFVRQHVEDLLRTIRTQVLRRVIRPYTRISLAAIAKELNDISVAEVEHLLVSLILNGTLRGQIDQVHGVLIKQAERGQQQSQQQQSQQQQQQAQQSNQQAQQSNQQTMTKVQLEITLLEQKYAAMDKLVKTMDELSSSIANTKMKESMSMRGLAMWKE